MKKALALVLVLVLALAFTAFAFAEGEAPEDAWHADKPINVIVPYGAGGGSDILARIFAAHLDIGDSIVVTNIAGGGTSIGVYEAYDSEPDGYTLLLSLPETMMAGILTGVFDIPVHENLIPVCSVVYDASIITVSNSSQFKSIDDLVAYAKDHPGELQWASVGAKGNNRFGYEQFCAAAGISANFIPYDNASESRTAVLGNNADVLQGSISEALPYVLSGDLIPLAVMMENRSTQLPEVPTLKEKGFEVLNGLHRAFWLPANTPAEIVSAYEASFKRAYENPEVIAACAEQGAEMVWTGSAELRQFVTENAPVFAAIYENIK